MKWGWPDIFALKSTGFNLPWLKHTGCDIYRNHKICQKKTNYAKKYHFYWRVFCNDAEPQDFISANLLGCMLITSIQCFKYKKSIFRGLLEQQFWKFICEVVLGFIHLAYNHTYMILNVSPTNQNINIRQAVLMVPIFSSLLYGHLGIGHALQGMLSFTLSTWTDALATSGDWFRF